MEKSVLDEAVNRLIRNHLEEYTKIKFECQKEFDAISIKGDCYEK